MHDEKETIEKSALQFETKKPKLKSSKEKETRLQDKKSSQRRIQEKKTVPPNESGGSVSSHTLNHSRKVPTPEKMNQNKSSKLKFEDKNKLKSSEEVRTTRKEEKPRLSGKDMNKLGRLKYKSMKSEANYQKSKGKLPTKKKRSLKFETVESGTSKNHRLSFGKEEFTRTTNSSKFLNTAKKELGSQTKDTFKKALEGGEREQSIEEQQTKGIVNTGKNVVLAPIKAHTKFKRFRNERNIRKFHKAEKELVKSNVKFDMQSMKVQDKLSGTKKMTNPLSKAFQKRRLKKGV